MRCSHCLTCSIILLATCASALAFAHGSQTQRNRPTPESLLLHAETRPSHQHQHPDTQPRERRDQRPLDIPSQGANRTYGHRRKLPKSPTTSEAPTDTGGVLLASSARMTGSDQLQAHHKPPGSQPRAAAANSSNAPQAEESDLFSSEPDVQPPRAPHLQASPLLERSPGGTERRGRDMQRSPASLRSTAPTGFSPRSAASAGLSPRSRLPENLWTEDIADDREFHLDDSSIPSSTL